MKIKKMIVFFCVLFINMSIVKAGEIKEVKLYKCVDGDTAWFSINGETLKARFLAIDTPESTTTIEKYGKEASEYTCNKLKKANKIVLEYDDNSDKTDKYNRELVWVWVDGKLLQEELLKEGLAELKYLYGDYDYTPNLTEIENQAKTNKLNIWSDDTEEEIDYIIIILGALGMIILLLTKKGRKKIKNEMKKALKKEIN